MIKNRVKNIKKSQKICVCFCFINVSKTTLLLSLFADESNQAKTRFTRQSKGAATHFDFSSQLLYCFFSGFERPHSFPFLFFFVERGLCFFLSVSRAWFLGSFGFQNVTNLYSHVIIFNIYLAQQSWILFTSVLYMSTRYCAIWCRPLSHVQNTLLIIILSSHIKGSLSFILIYYYNFLDFILFFFAAKNLIIYIEITLNHPRVLNYLTH